MVDQEVDLGLVLLTHADFDGVGHFQKRIDAAELAQPHGEIVVKELMADRADVNGPPIAIGMSGHGGASGVEILGVTANDLATLGFDDIAPEPSGMHVSGAKSALEREMVFLTRRQGIKLEHLESKQIGHVMWKTGIRRDVMLVDQARVAGGHEGSTVLHV